MPKALPWDHLQEGMKLMRWESLDRSHYLCEGLAWKSYLALREEKNFLFASDTSNPRGGALRTGGNMNHESEGASVVSITDNKWSQVVS